MQNVVALIPARAGSKGVIDKNIRPLGCHPLLNWTIKACLMTKNIDRVIVSTDSTKYAEIANDAGAEVPFIRPSEIAMDNSTDYEFIIHAINWMISQKYEPSLIVHMRPTTPYRDPVLISEAIQLFMSNPGATALRSVHEMSESAYKAFEINELNQLKCVGVNSTQLDFANNARQGFPKTYQANGYVDVLSVPFILKEKKIHGDSVLPFVTPYVTEVDTEEDFSYLEYQLLNKTEISEKLFKS